MVTSTTCDKFNVVRNISEIIAKIIYKSLSIYMKCWMSEKGFIDHRKILKKMKIFTFYWE